MKSTIKQPTRLFQITTKFELVGPFEPTWINHRWHHYGRTFRSLRLLKSDKGYKFASKAASSLRKEIDKEVLNILLGKS